MSSRRPARGRSRSRRAHSERPRRRPPPSRSPTARRSATAERRARPGRRSRCELQHARSARMRRSRSDGRMRLRAFCGLPDGSEWLRDELERGRLRSGGARRSDWRSACAPLVVPTSWRERRRWRHRMTDGPGIVYLVGAGPRGPGADDHRSLELIVAADVIVHDRLIPSGRPGARPPRRRAPLRRQGAGRRRAWPRMSIADLLIDRARQGKIVVRLKGGDPFVFGRGGEEAEALAEAEIPFEVVPGVTAGCRRAGLRGHPSDPPRRRLRGRLRHRARGPREGGLRARLRGAGRVSRARSSSTWASRRCRGSPSALIERGAGRVGAGRGRRAGHPARASAR